MPRNQQIKKDIKSILPPVLWNFRNPKYIDYYFSEIDEEVAVEIAEALSERCTLRQSMGVEDVTITDGEYHMRKVERDFWLTEKAYPILVRLMKAAGVDTDREFEGPAVIINECFKKRLIGDISINKNGYPELDDVLPIKNKKS